MVFPGAGTPLLDPWENSVAVDGYGVYQMFMIAAPTGTSYDDLKLFGNSIYEYATYYEGWYATTGAVIADPDIYNCINKKRYEFLNSIMSGDCDNKYLEMYGLFVGAINAFSIGTDEAYIQGMELIDKLREECIAEGCNCNTSPSCNC